MKGTFWGGLVDGLECENIVEGRKGYYFDISGLLQHRKLLSDGDEIDYDYRYDCYWVISVLGSSDALKYVL